MLRQRLRHLGGSPLVLGTLVCLLLVPMTGCGPSKLPEPLPAPKVELQQGHYTGSVLSGPLPAQPPTADPAKTPALQVTFFALENLPVTALEPLGSQARLIAAARGREPVLPTARLTLRSRIGRSDDTGKLDESWLKRAGRSVTVGSNFAAVPSGMTAWFRIAEIADAADAAALHGNLRSLELRISRRDPLPTPPTSNSATLPTTTAPAAPQYEIAVLVDDLIPAGEVTLVTPADIADVGPGTGTQRFGVAPKIAGTTGSNAALRNSRSNPATVASPDKSPVYQREIAVLDGPALDRAQTLMFLVPLNLGNGPSRVVAIRLQTLPAVGDDSEKLDAVRASIDAALQSRNSAANRPSAAPTGNATWSAILVAMRSLERADVRRSALLYLAAQTQGILASDAILASDDTVLEWFAQRFVQLTDQRPVSPAQPQELGWLLDLATWQVLSEMLSNQALPRELSSILVVHAGESARRASSLEEVLNSVPSRTELRRRLILENQVFLEDSSPSSRIRAMEWLTTQNAAPANYDPMAPLAQRRAALEKAVQDASGPRPEKSDNATSKSDTNASATGGDK